MLSNVCVVLHVDGYYVGGKLQIRELGYQALAKNFTPNSVHFMVEEPTTNIDVRMAEYSFRHIHGLPLFGGSLPQDLVDFSLSRIYNCNKTEERPYVAINDQKDLEILLNKLNIPYIDLQKIGCPSDDDGPFIKENYSCHQHRFGKRCSQTLVASYSKWIFNIIYFTIIYRND